MLGFTPRRIVPRSGLNTIVNSEPASILRIGLWGTVGSAIAFRSPKDSVTNYSGLLSHGPRSSCCKAPPIQVLSTLPAGCWYQYRTHTFNRKAHRTNCQPMRSHAASQHCTSAFCETMPGLDFGRCRCLLTSPRIRQGNKRLSFQITLKAIRAQKA